MGVVSPLGSDIQTFWDNLLLGKSGISHVQEFSDLPVTFGGKASGFDPERHLGGQTAPERQLDEPLLVTGRQVVDPTLGDAIGPLEPEPAVETQEELQ